MKSLLMSHVNQNHRFMSRMLIRVRESRSRRILCLSEFRKLRKLLRCRLADELS